VSQLDDLLSSDEVILGEDVLAAIDDIDSPEASPNPADEGWTPPPLEDKALRRRARPCRTGSLATVS
jgi:hypothetical protein